MRRAVLVGMLALAMSSASAAPADTQAKVDAVFSDLATGGVPGCAAGVTQDGRILAMKGYGLADIATHRPIDPDTVFNIASMSKQFTAFSILLLAHDKRLSLDDPVARYIPEVAASARGVTIYQLLHHTGGLRDYTTLLQMAGVADTAKATTADALAILARQTRPDFPAGSEWVYSNTGYFLLAQVVERVSGMRLREFEQRHIFAPLGLKATTVVDHYPTGIAALARGYTPDAHGFALDETQWEADGDGEVHSTIGDLLTWSGNFLTRRYAPRILSLLLRTGRLADGRPLDYAGGLFVTDYRGVPVVRHSGYWVGYRSDLLRFPKQKLSIVVLCNRNDVDPRRRAERIADLFLPPAILSDAPPAFALALGRGAISDPSAIATGVYQDERSAEFIHVTRDEKGLHFASKNEPSAVVPIAPGVLHVEAWESYAAFPAVPAATAPRLVVETAREHQDFRLVPAWAPTDPARYVGVYESAELGTRYEVIATPTGLALHAVGREFVLSPVAADYFETSDVPLNLRFAPGSGPAAGFELSGGGVRYLAFRRPAPAGVTAP